MQRLLPLVLRSWSLPLIVVALVAPAVVAFSLVGPQLGLAVGALTVGALIVLAARARYDEEIVVATSPDDRYRLLVVASHPLEDAATIELLAALANEGEDRARNAEAAELRVIAPVQQSLLARWASDLAPARAAAQRALAISLGSLAAAGLDAAGRVGDGDPVQAIEDELHTFAATEVALIVGPGIGADEVEEVRRRLDRPVRELAAGSPSRSPGAG